MLIEIFFDMCLFWVMAILKIATFDPNNPNADIKDNGMPELMSLMCFFVPSILMKFTYYLMFI